MPDNFNPNPEQQAVIDAIDGNHVVISGPGTGKTTTLVQRYIKMLSKGIFTKDILNLTFTSSGAEAMVKKVGLLNSESIFRTFHSFALELLNKERQHLPFQLCDKIIPVQGEDYRLLFDLTKTYPAIENFRKLKDKISAWKNAGIFPDEAMEQAYSNGPEFFYAAAFRDYEKKCREQGWLDFDSVIDETLNLLESNQEVRERWVRKYISVDEGQDTDDKQFRILQLIYGGNIQIIGDENQCQPPGTKILVLVKSQTGRGKIVVKQKSIELLDPRKHLIIPWDTKLKRVRAKTGRSFKIAAREYSGSLLSIKSNGKTTRLTPDHFVWTKFNIQVLEKEENNHFVYLMWKKGYGFRVGVSRFRRTCGANQISHRGYQEKANKMWILRTAKTASEATTLEEIYSLTYGISESVFFGGYANARKTKEQIKRIFKASNPTGGFKCLEDHGLLFQYPLASWPHKQHLTKFHGYFKTVAANLIPRCMELPTEKTYESAIIDSISKESYTGSVYSLDVEKDHTYVADGIPVGNCVFEFRNAKPQNLTNFHQRFDNVNKLFMGINYRSTRRLVEFFKKIVPVDNGIASRMESNGEEGTDPVFIKYADDFEEATKVLEQIVDPINTAVIARTNRQLFIFQRLAAMKGIKYKILGKKDFFETNEVKRLLQLAKENQHSSKSASEVLTELIRDHNLSNIYRHSGSPTEGDPIENLNSIVKMAAKKGNVTEFLDWLRRMTHARKSVKGLTLSTCHQSKGHEYNHVYIVGAHQGMMPHTDGEFGEEKRILFVACTRAAKTLQISFWKKRSEFLNDFEKEIKVYGEKKD